MNHSSRVVAQTLGFFAAVLVAAATQSPDLPTVLEPMPSLVAYASKQRIPLSGLSVADSREPAVGDEVTALVHLESKVPPRQWLITLRVAPLTEKEQRTKPPTSLILYTSTGRRLEFGYKPMAIELLTRGPFVAGAPTRSKPQEKRARALLNAEFLALGLDGASRTGLRLHEAAMKQPGKGQGRFGFSSTPFSPESVRATKHLADAIGITAADERAFTSMMPALFAFFGVAQNAPGLQDILEELVDRPRLMWSFLRHGGELEPFFHNDMSGIRILDSSSEHFGKLPVYRFPVTVALNGAPTLTCTLAVTSPRPPLLACGGIIAAAAEPTERDGRRLEIRVLATRSGRSPDRSTQQRD